MKRKLAWALGIFLLLFVGFAAGAIWQDGKNGFHQSLVAETVFDSSIGAVHWKHISESIGYQSIQPSLTMIEFGDRIIYKARGDFQESVPFAKILSVTNNTIVWDDGELRGELRFNLRRQIP